MATSLLTSQYLITMDKIHFSFFVLKMSACNTMCVTYGTHCTPNHPWKEGSLRGPSVDMLSILQATHK